MECCYSHDLLHICPFATNVNSNALHLLSPVLHPQDCCHQTQMIRGNLKLNAHLPLHLNLLCDTHSVKTDRQLIISLLFCVPGVALTKWNFPNSRAHKLWGGHCHCGRINQTFA
jgi:hypothetical protein